MKWSFSLAIELSYCSKHTKSTVFLSYQASLAYNPKEFLGVITPITHHMYYTKQNKSIEAVYMYITIKSFYKKFMSKDQNLKI
jgi:hypothetical protein